MNILYWFINLFKSDINRIRMGHELLEVDNFYFLTVSARSGQDPKKVFKEFNSWKFKRLIKKYSSFPKYLNSSAVEEVIHKLSSSRMSFLAFDELRWNSVNSKEFEKTVLPIFLIDIDTLRNSFSEFLYLDFHHSDMTKKFNNFYQKIVIDPETLENAVASWSFCEYCEDNTPVTSYGYCTKCDSRLKFFEESEKKKINKRLGKIAENLAEAS